jgi:hypothetical protein
MVFLAVGFVLGITFLVRDTVFSVGEFVVFPLQYAFTGWAIDFAIPQRRKQCPVNCSTQ